MGVCSRGFQCAAVLLFVCGCLQAVTITPLPYRGNESGYRLPRGTATFLDQEEGNRIRREMAERGPAGSYGGSNVYGSTHNYVGNRYSGNEIDRDVYYDRKSRDYYPNYNPDGGSSDRWAQDCYPQAEPHDNNAISSYNLARRGYINRRTNDDNRRGTYSRNTGRGFEEQNRGYRPQYDTDRSGFVDVWARRGYYGNSDKDDNVGEGTVGFYGRSRRE